MTKAVIHPLMPGRAEFSNETPLLRKCAIKSELLTTIDEKLTLSNDWDKLREQSTILLPNEDRDRNEQQAVLMLKSTNKLIEAVVDEAWNLRTFSELTGENYKSAA